MRKAHYSFRKATNGNNVVRVRKGQRYFWFDTFIDAGKWVIDNQWW